MRSCVLSRGRSNVCHKKISLVSFRDINRHVYPGAPADAIIFKVITISSQKFHIKVTYMVYYNNKVIWS